MYFTNRFGKYNIRYNIDDNTKILNKTPTCFKNLGTLFQKKNYDALFDVAEFKILENVDIYQTMGNIYHNYFIKNSLHNLDQPFEKKGNIPSTIDLHERLQNSLRSLHKRYYKRSLDDDNNYNFEETTDYEDYEDYGEYEDYNKYEVEDTVLPLSETCLYAVKTHLNMALTKYYIENYYSENQTKFFFLL
ncbi:hypothetical protein H8356DRAFT_1407410 [Neocallimastix lanati (nom. inval.)]|nr:hypothetical protein H8356DRAFT_1407410 [Neocallimastix sp. JGI-2020a]